MTDTVTTNPLVGPLDEPKAIRVAAQGNPLSRIMLGLRAGLGLARDPGNTENVFMLAIATDWDRLAGIADRLAQQPGGAALLSDQPAIDTRSVDYGKLRELGPDTLGGAYARMLDEKQLDPDIFQPAQGLPEEAAFVSQRIRQTHDIWHVLTGLDTDIRGEVALQAFSYAQLGQRFSLYITIFGTLIYGLRHRGTLSLARRFFQVGKRAPFLLAFRWEQMWEEPLASVRARCGLDALPTPS